MSPAQARMPPCAPVCPRVGRGGHPAPAHPVIIIRLNTELWPGKQREPGARTRHATPEAGLPVLCVTQFRYDGGCSWSPRT